MTIKTISNKPSSTRANKTSSADKVNGTDSFVSQFRGIAQYINAHRGKTFVITFSGGMVAESNDSTSEQRLHELIHDIALLNSLGIRLVLVHGTRPQIEHRLQEFGIESDVINGLRVTNSDALLCVKEAVGNIRIDLEGRLSTGLPNSPMSGADIRVVSGNFVTARPLGVREGVDYQLTGEVRRIDVTAIKELLDSGFIVLLSPIGTSPTGEIFNLSSEDVATSASIHLGADKMLSLIDEPGLLNSDDKLIRQLTPDEAETILSSRKKIPEQTARHLISAIHACREGLRRAHIINSDKSGALLQELFTRDGVGTMITSDPYEEIRPASIEDVGGIIELIHPMEEDGVLVPRSRELLEIEIDHYTVMERDGTIIGVVALYPDQRQKMAEVASLAIHPEYQDKGRGELLLEHLDHLLLQGRWGEIKELFVLSTRASHWFQEQGYTPARLADLPIKRQALYNYKRNSKVFIRSLDGQPTGVQR